MQKFKGLEGAAALLGAAVIYATFGIFVREMAKMFGDSTQVTVRFLLAALVAGIVCLIAKKTFKLSKKELLLTAVFGVAFGVVVLLYTISVNNTKIANSVFLLYAGSIFSSFLIGTFIFKEAVTVAKVVAIVIGIAGLAMYSSAFLALSVGVVAGFISGLFDGVANALRKKLKGVDRNLVIMYSYLVGSVIASVVLLFSGEKMINQISLVPVLATIVFVLLLVFFRQLVAFWFPAF